MFTKRITPWQGTGARPSRTITRTASTWSCMAGTCWKSLGTKEAKDFIDALERGMKFIHLDVRWNYTAANSDRFFIVRPGTDYTFNLALINVILKERLYDAEFVDRWVIGLKERQNFVSPYTPEWAEKETGIPAKAIITIAHEASAAKPAVIFDQGWRLHGTRTITGSGDRYTSCTRSWARMRPKADSSLPRANLPRDTNRSGPLPLSSSKVDKPRFDGIGTKYKHLSADYGMAQMIPHAILNEDPYPVKAFVWYRLDPLSSFPDPVAFTEGLKKLDLLVSIDVNYSHTGWMSDVILPEATDLERTDPLIVKECPKPALWMRRQAVTPKFDAKPKWWIVMKLAERLGIGQYFPYNTIEELIDWQLQDTGISRSDFDEKGYVDLAKQRILWDRKDGLKFKTASGKFEIVSSMLENNGIASLPPYESPQSPPEGHFRLVTGKIALHTQGTSLNNRCLNEVHSENTLWINTQEAAKRGIKDSYLVQVSTDGVTQTVKATLTDHIHPEVVHALHGYGRQIPLQTRAFNKGMRDNTLMTGLLSATIGGNCPNTDCFVRIKKAS